MSELKTIIHKAGEVIDFETVFVENQGLRGEPKKIGRVERVDYTTSVYEDGVNFYEVILNIYEDMDPEGERRFLLDAKKEIPHDWLNRDVIATSHGNFLLGMETPEKTA